ncbi:MULTISPECIES: hypothetical protein [Nostocales]|uniref:Uncharacterized protein n=2 Tax=Nostocales TaxID=1161 RepID=A0A0C1RD01_9CYAN|nr:hypothetical protein [Tolypothrix bouteillei]KAF3886047.1 hypothetical protein DA73_0400011620 [Tolypothrix bouteillei VB521301]
MNTISTDCDRADTLIITVGTRQIGWRCKDGVIRSFGADGNISYPHHVNELYQELGLERGNHEEQDKTYPWSAKDLGKRYYEHCTEWLGGDFSQVELLLDHTIITTGVERGLKHIILWGTDQPETVSWFYRRLDTVWLAALMAGKIKSICPHVRIDVHAPKISANDSDAIRQELEVLILQEALDFFSPVEDKELVLWVQNKGCAPAIASGVEICAAALARQCEVYNASPQEPELFFDTLPNGSRTAMHSQSFKLIPMGEHFWSLERMRVISAWERGDFSEAQLWLKPHQSRYKSLYKLAGILALYTNWETKKFLIAIENWVRSNDVAKVTSNEQIQAWQEQLHQFNNSQLIKTWESSFLIEIPLLKRNYSTAFMQFTQIVERLLCVQCDEQNWMSRGYITQIPGQNYPPSLLELIEGWRRSHNLSEDNKWYKLLNRIRKKRNKVVHYAESLTFAQIRTIWAECGLFTASSSEESEVIKSLMFSVLKQVSPGVKIENLLVPSLYKWGLDLLKSSPS